MKHWLNSLQLSRAERNGMLVLVCVIVLLLGTRLWLIYWQPALPESNHAQFRQEIAAFEADTLLELNTARADALEQLPGIGPSMAEKIIAYREEIGGYSYAEQLMDIPGLGEAKLNGLLPYISIDVALAKMPATRPQPSAEKEPPTTDTVPWPTKLKPHETIELNSATLYQLQQLPGIGLAFAQRIEGYRNRLGGFVHTDQLKEVAGLGEAKFNALVPHLTLNPKAIRRLNVNTATETELLAHPYAKADWVTMVIQNRPYGTLQAIPKEGMDEKILPYLVF